MASYEEKLIAFAQGKKLLRLPRPIRDRADAFCDACGSTLPRTLFALKDLESGRYYFAGVNCLKELGSQGVILRRFGKESGQAAYEAEMRLRSEETPEELNRQERLGAIQKDVSTVGPSGDPLTSALSGMETVQPAIFMIQYPDHYSAFVLINFDGGKSQKWDYAEESRWEERWCRAGVGSMVLEKVRDERSEAARVCIARAWQEAHSSKGSLEWTPRPSDGPKSARRDESTGLPDSLLAMLELADQAKFGNSRIMVDKEASTKEIALWKK